MKKMVFALLLVVLLLSLTLSVALAAGLGVEDPCAPGHANNGNARCFAQPPVGLQYNNHGNAGGNWVPPH